MNFIVYSLSLLVCITPITSHAFPSFKEEIVQPLDIEIYECRKDLQIETENNVKVLQLFDETIDLWYNYHLVRDQRFDLSKLLKAISFSAKKHKGQTRKDKDATPYIIHPIGVAKSIFAEGNVVNVDILVAALLHDTLEDTDTTKDELTTLFGETVALTVEEVSNDPRLTPEANKERQVAHAPFLSYNAKVVKLADRLYNVRDLRDPPPSWDQEKIDAYRNWGAKLLLALKGTNAKLEKLLAEEIESEMTPQ